MTNTDQLSAVLGDEVIILALRDSVYYGLSKVGARIWELLQVPRTVNEITAILVREYEVTSEEAGADLQDLLADLHSRGLVAITPPEQP